jgi:hypothetical protein
MGTLLLPVPSHGDDNNSLKISARYGILFSGRHCKVTQFQVTAYSRNLKL